MPHAPRHILVPTDFSPSAAAALEYAVTLCEQFDARLTLLHVTNQAKVEEELKGMDSLSYLFKATDELDPTAAPPASVPTMHWDRLSEVAQRKLATAIQPDWKGRVELETVCRDGYPSQTITEYARANGVDLIVMGTQGRGRTAQFVMGSVTQNVIRGADCPVLTVKAPPAPPAGAS